MATAIGGSTQSSQSFSQSFRQSMVRIIAVWWNGDTGNGNDPMLSCTEKKREIKSKEKVVDCGEELLAAADGG